MNILFVLVYSVEAHMNIDATQESLAERRTRFRLIVFHVALLTMHYVANTLHMQP